MSVNVAALSIHGQKEIEIFKVKKKLKNSAELSCEFFPCFDWCVCKLASRW